MSRVFQSHPIKKFTEFSCEVITASMRFRGKHKKRSKYVYGELLNSKFWGQGGGRS